MYRVQERGGANGFDDNGGLCGGLERLGIRDCLQEEGPEVGIQQRYLEGTFHR